MEKETSFAKALLVLGINVVTLMLGVVVLGLEPHVPILINIGIVLLFGRKLKITWDELIAGMYKTLAESVGVLLTVLMVGVVVGTWTMCGTVPTVIYYGLLIFSPKWFLLSILLLCFAMAFVTGSSWTTAGTIGVAFMGVGISLGIPAGITAGCIISGALCGDLQSPLGAATNLTASVSKADLYETLKSLALITIPTIIMCGIFFTFIGFEYGDIGADTKQVTEIMQGIMSEFYISPVMLIPIAVLFSMILLKIPTVPTLITASVSGIFLSAILQGNSLKLSFMSMYSGYLSDTGIELLDKLLTRGGLMSMSSTVLLIIFALALAGCLERTKVMIAVVEKISSILKQRFSLIVTSYAISTILGFFSADCHMAIVLSSNAMQEKYDEIGIKRTVLARTVHDGATGLAPLIPWTTAGVYMSSTLGASVGEYLPYFALGYIMTVVTLLSAFTGRGL